jgi:hypothetical protein
MCGSQLPEWACVGASSNTEEQNATEKPSNTEEIFYRYGGLGNFWQSGGEIRPA